MSSPQNGGLNGMFGGARNATVVLVAFIVVAGVAIGGIAYYLFAPRSNLTSTPPPVASPIRPADTRPTGPACTDPPTVEPTSWELTAEGLAMKVELSSTCADPTVLSDAQTTVTASMGKRDIAAGIFDLERDPIPIPTGETTSRTFVFPAGMYWRIPELIDGSAEVEMFPSGGPSSVQSSSTGSSTLSAVDSAPPAYGSEESAATNALRELAAYDRPEVRTYLEDRWVPQIGSKRVGLVAEGITWTTVDILRDHLQYRQRFDDVRLVWSADWTSFSTDDFWVTVVADPFATARQANRWCDSHGIDAFNCFAKMISSTYGTEGTTVLRK